MEGGTTGVLFVVIGDDGQLSLQYDKDLRVGVLVPGRGVSGGFDEMLDGDVCLVAEADPFPVFFGFVVFPVSGQCIAKGGDARFFGNPRAGEDRNRTGVF